MSRLGTLPRRIPSVLAAAAVLLSTACTDGGTPTRQVNPDAVDAGVSDTLAGQAPPPAERCHKSGNVPAAKVVITTEDNVRLAGVRFGSGGRGVLLLPQRGADLCPWWDYAASLVGSGFHVLAIDLRGTGFSEDSPNRDYTKDAAAGIAELRRQGAQRVVLLGASLGAAAALVTAGRLPDQIAGVVSLSYPDNDLDVTGGSTTWPRTPAEAAPLTTAPMLLCFTAGDASARSAKPQALIASAQSPAKQLVGRPGVSHGWDMLKVGADDVTAEVLAFLQSYA
jgi:pimeloyl-ACP methyl ester carboxylesterase